MSASRRPLPSAPRTRVPAAFLRGCGAWRAGRLVAVLTLALLAPGSLPGCLYVGGHASLGPRLHPEIVADIVVGATTKADVLAMLGPPAEYLRPELAVALLDDRSRLSGALAAANRAQHVFTWQFDSVDVDGTVLLLFNGFSVDTRTDLLVVFFDEDDVVADVALRHDGRVQ